LSFTSGGFFGYATMFSIHAADATAFGVPGVPGEIIAAIVSMFIGAVIGVTTDTVTATYAK
jgi:tetrahydromethanopterin S-methyltransferase subunit C